MKQAQSPFIWNGNFTVPRCIWAVLFLFIAPSFFEVQANDTDNDGVADLSDSCQKGDLDWQSYNATDSDADGCQDLTEDLDYELPDDRGENPVECNPFIANCEDVDEEEEPIDTSDSEESVQSMILGLLAMALVPTILGGLLIAYRIQW